MLRRASRAARTGSWAGLRQLLFGLEALPGGGAWTAGNMGHVRVSRDGGDHWTVAASFGRSEPRHARHLSFLDGRRGLIASQEELAITDDGGSPLKVPVFESLTAPRAAMRFTWPRGSTRRRGPGAPASRREPLSPTPRAPSTR